MTGGGAGATGGGGRDGWGMWAPAFAGDTGGVRGIRWGVGGIRVGGGGYGWSAGDTRRCGGDTDGVRGIRGGAGGIRMGWGDSGGVRGIRMGWGDSGGGREGGLEVGGLAGWVLGFLLDDLPGLGYGIVQAAVFVGDDVFELVLARHLSLSLL